MHPIEQILALLRRGASADYDSDQITQLAHALQCATLAEEAGAASPLIVAALLHDIGHLVHQLGPNVARRGIDDRHEVRGRDWLGKWFAEDVTGPVRLHVDAKRYLCATDADYFSLLSPASVRSLALQGGPFPIALAEGFIGLPHAKAAVQLRRWDEGAKIPGRVTPDLDHFRPHLEMGLRLAA
ncbi:MAG TPA: HD domain-containing protein [Stellaceae bacterium]|nr:HD domain-containing protein [Stellaceae bacterium]